MKIQKDEDAYRDEDAGSELSIFFIFVGSDPFFSTISTPILLFFFPLPITQIA